jgi:ATP-dependent DNA helicase RecG
LKRGEEGFEKIKEACGLYDGPLPEYKINEAGIMVLCKACDKYLELLRNDGQNHDQFGYDSWYKPENVIIRTV